MLALWIHVWALCCNCRLSTERFGANRRKCKSAYTSTRTCCYMYMHEWASRACTWPTCPFFIWSIFLPSLVMGKSLYLQILCFADLLVGLLVSFSLAATLILALLLAVVFFRRWETAATSSMMYYVTDETIIWCGVVDDAATNYMCYCRYQLPCMMCYCHMQQPVCMMCYCHMQQPVCMMCCHHVATSVHDVLSPCSNQCAWCIVTMQQPVCMMCFVSDAIITLHGVLQHTWYNYCYLQCRNRGCMEVLPSTHFDRFCVSSLGDSLWSLKYYWQGKWQTHVLSIHALYMPAARPLQLCES